MRASNTLLISSSFLDSSAKCRIDNGRTLIWCMLTTLGSSTTFSSAGSTGNRDRKSALECSSDLLYRMS
ncbi:unnamed protein product [Ilex paraguariensis]|uniref:Uncharacterized protein n=1 Tax=Ilex paraguariensis TaxID=185542 RepID=A0ABC8V5I4_9AQUA